MKGDSRGTRYKVDRSGDLNVTQEISAEVGQLLEALCSDPDLRKTALKQKVDLDSFDDQVRLLKEANLSAAALVGVEDDEQGLTLTELALIAIIVPPVVEHYVAPVAVHVTKSVWDKIIFPRLLQRFPSLAPVAKDEGDEPDAGDTGASEDEGDGGESS